MTDSFKELSDKPNSREKVAESLGLVNVYALDEWESRIEHTDAQRLEWLYAEMCNLRQRVKALERDSHVESNPRIGSASDHDWHR